jgi:radical SAM protein with 4Fe4S-binding SPASM domain
MDFGLFEKLIADLAAFPDPIKVMRMNKIGEPLLNKKLAKMIEFAKQSGRVQYIDLATNAALFSPALLSRLVEAGLDRLNISLEGIDSEQYKRNAKVDIDFDQLINNIRWLYSNRGACEVTIKIPANYIDDQQRARFFETFGDYCDRIFVEELAPIWPQFDVEKRAGIVLHDMRGQYQQKPHEKLVCTYIFYAMAINSDGTVSACCPDWDQKLIVGDLKRESLRDIWNSKSLISLRRQHLRGERHLNSICRDCGHIKHSQIDNIDAHRRSLLDRVTTVSAAVD